FIATLFMRGTPEEMGQKPYGYDEVIKKENEEALKNKVKPFVWSLGKAIKTPAFWTIVAMYFCSNFAEYIVFSHSVNYVVTDRGFALKTATWIYSLIGLCFLFFGPIGGSYADKLGARLQNEFLGRKRVLTASYLIVAAASAWLSFVDTPWMYVVFAIAYGIPFGVYIPCVAAYVGTTFGRESMGAIWGLVTVFGVAAGCGLGPYVGGLLKDITGNYQASIWLATGIYLLAAILAASVKKPEAKGTPIN
ncbi:MAG: MFS transporter, partial [Dethiobacteria bacterium]